MSETEKANMVHCYGVAINGATAPGYRILETVSPLYNDPESARHWLSTSKRKYGRYVLFKTRKGDMRTRRRFLVQYLEKLPAETIVVEVEKE